MYGFILDGFNKAFAKETRAHTPATGAKFRRTTTGRNVAHAKPNDLLTKKISSLLKQRYKTKWKYL